MAIDGFSTTIFCYGQTGSGKTHTLTGPPYLVRFNKNKYTIFFKQNLCREIFSKINVNFISLGKDFD